MYFYRAALFLLLIGSLAVAPVHKAPTLVFHLPGIGGERSVDHWFAEGLKTGGLEAEFQVHDWTHGEIGLPALQAYERNRAEAKALCESLTEQIRRDPARKVIVTSHSGGCGLAVWALEEMPADLQVESLYMFQPALSPRYDLTRALRHVKGKAYVFSSPFDSFVLGAGTKMFGTIDGIKTEAAGLNGFVRPAGADEKEYAKLVPVPYQREWLTRYGNAGTHICSMRTYFVKEFVVPIMLTGNMPAAPATRPATAAR